MMAFRRPEFFFFFLDSMKMPQYWEAVANNGGIEKNQVKFLLIFFKIFIKRQV